MAGLSKQKVSRNPELGKDAGGEFFKKYPGTGNPELGKDAGGEFFKKYPGTGNPELGKDASGELLKKYPGTGNPELGQKAVASWFLVPGSQFRDTVCYAQRIMASSLGSGSIGCLGMTRTV